MAIAQAWSPKDSDDIFDSIKTYDYAIGGKMVVAKYEYNDLDMVLDDKMKSAIRSQLVHQIADYMFQNNMVEFTQMKTPQFTIIVRARCYVAPNDQVKILRSVHKVE